MSSLLPPRSLSKWPNHYLIVLLLQAGLCFSTLCAWKKRNLPVQTCGQKPLEQLSGNCYYLAVAVFWVTHVLRNCSSFWVKSWGERWLMLNRYINTTHSFLKSSSKIRERVENVTVLINETSVLTGEAKLWRKKLPKRIHLRRYFGQTVCGHVKAVLQKRLHS